MSEWVTITDMRCPRHGTLDLNIIRGDPDTGETQYMGYATDVRVKAAVLRKPATCIQCEREGVPAPHGVVIATEPQ